MRIAGGLAVTALCVLIGWGKAYALVMRERILRAFSEDLAALASEISYRPRDIRNMLKKLDRGMLWELWHNFSCAVDETQSTDEAWRYAVKGYDALAVLKDDEYSLIFELGGYIGQLGLRDSVKVFMHKSSEAAHLAEKLREQISRKGAVYKKLGLLSGLAAMLLIV